MPQYAASSADDREDVVELGRQRALVQGRDRWIVGFNGHSGTGMVFGVIGGYEEGGDYPWASYSVYFGPPTLKLYWQAEAQQF